MKVAVSAAGQGLTAEVSLVFGRCPYFVIVEIEGKDIKSTESIENSAMSQAGGAGIAAAELVGNQKAEAVVAGAMGPRAFGVLQQLGIRQYIAVPGTVKHNVEMLIGEKLKEISAATSPMRMQPGMGAGMGPGRGAGMGAGRGRR